MATLQTGTVNVHEATSAGDFQQARKLFQAYVSSVNRPDCFDGFAGELTQLEHVYARPQGGLYLAFQGNVAAGCCAFRSLPDADHSNACEMRRLYVVPAFRGTGLGHRLVMFTMDAARVSGFSCVLLDTLSEMESARALYEQMGFTEVPPFAPSPVPGAHHLKAML